MIQDNTQNNKRIAKNTAYLYIRLLFTAFISLYTARLILKNLGVEDFGIYNVVAGIVTFMGFLNATLSSATQRFLTYNLGLNDSTKFRQTFSLLINIYLIFCAIVFVVLEIVGPIYISHYMTISPERIYAAQWVFQFSLLSFIFSTITVPHRSSIIAYEKMGMYAYIGVAEAVFGLVAVIVLPYLSYDKLIIYALLMCIIQLGIALVLVYYCRFRLQDCRYIKYWDSAYFKELLAYSGWNLFGSVSSVLILQGQAIVLNYFFGPIVNAAKAVADRVNSMISQFSNNFYMATAPQIIKSYAANNIEYMRSLVLNSSRYSFLMLLIIAAPLFVVMDSFLDLWLGTEQVTFDMVLFCQWTVIVALISILEQPITQAVRATGDIKKYQIYVGLITLSFLPLCIVLFFMGVPAYYSMILMSIVFLIALFIRILIVSPIIQIKPVNYYKSVIVPIVGVSLIVILVLFFLFRVDYIGDRHWILRFIIAFFVVAFISLFCGITRSERLLLWNFMRSKISFKR